MSGRSWITASSFFFQVISKSHKKSNQGKANVFQTYFLICDGSFRMNRRLESRVNSKVNGRASA